MKYRELIAPLSEILTNEGVGFTETNSGELILDACFNCNRPKKLYAQADSGLFFCQRCNISGGPVQLLKGALSCNGKEAFVKLYGIQGPKSLRDDDIDDNTDLAIRVSGIKRKKAKSKVELPKPMTLPFYMKPIKNSDVDAMNYLKSRGLTNEMIKELNVHHWEVAGRVVFPVMLDDEIYGTLARDYTGVAERKVLNSSGNWRSFTVWNYDNARESETLILCEGAFSAIKCGINRTVALLGKVATDGQIEVIRSTNAKRIYICLDVGTDDEQYKLYNQLAIFYPGEIYKLALPPIRAVKCPICKKKSDFDERLELETFDCPHCKHHMDQSIALRELIDKAEYKDSGDYTAAEMNEYIAKAKKFKSGPSAW